MVGELLAFAQVGALAGSNVAAGASSRRGSAEATLLMASPVAVLVVLIPLVVVGSGWSSTAVGTGLLAGALGGLGLLMAYRALTGGAVGVVVPMITCATTVVVTVVGSTIDEMPSSGTWVGAMICVVAVVVLTQGGTAAGGTSVEYADTIGRSIALSAAAGSGFAAFMLLMASIDRTENLAGLAAARLCVLVIAIAAAVRARPGRSLIRAGARIAVVTGALDATGNLLMLAALGDLPVALLGAMSAASPAAAALLGRVVLHEHLLRHQVVGIAIACLGAVVVVAT